MAPVQYPMRMIQRPAVLFVCLGNICRSPLAEGAFRRRAAEVGLCVDADSAGTADYHVGSPPDPRSIAEAQRHGIDISGYKGRQLQIRDFLRFTHILALDHSNLANIQALAPPDATARVGLLMDAVPGREGAAVADPYYGGEENFADTWEDVDLAAQALVAAFTE
ncbi:low molecular weight protein-tyrosine-phosphatase [Qipengyuania sp. DSG2-2]|uniref:low molecular weight protein-tyrosine-phosphatase n=1 Tax=Qipengyuania sp. DGS2-2 TaxID=3349631 RepID=UPI0036D2D395